MRWHQVQGWRRFVHLSTDAVYGFDKPAIIDETTSLSRDRHPYIVSKVQIERLLMSKMSARRGAAPLTILRPSIVYGPGQNTWTTDVVSQLVAGTQLLVDGRQRAMLYHLCGIILWMLFYCRARRVKLLDRYFLSQTGLR